MVAPTGENNKQQPSTTLITQLWSGFCDSCLCPALVSKTVSFKVHWLTLDVTFVTGINEDDDDVFSSDSEEEDTIRASGTLSAQAQAAAAAAARNDPAMPTNPLFPGLAVNASATSTALSTGQPLHPIAAAGAAAAAAATAAAAAAAQNHQLALATPAPANPLVAAAQAAAAQVQPNLNGLPIECKSCCNCLVFYFLHSIVIARSMTFP